mmetsp:Transcript_95254/g.238763  ORF Transcript_95254/g.238763 Transcript_95254/m.238763 type:complete len:269 (+) Transcript_95254:313-1119(+)
MQAARQTRGDTGRVRWLGKEDVDSVAEAMLQAPADSTRGAAHTTGYVNHQGICGRHLDLQFFELALELLRSSGVTQKQRGGRFIVHEMAPWIRIRLLTALLYCLTIKPRMLNNIHAAAPEKPLLPLFRVCRHVDRRSHLQGRSSQPHRHTQIASRPHRHLLFGQHLHHRFRCNLLVVIRFVQEFLLQAHMLRAREHLEQATTRLNRGAHGQVAVCLHEGPCPGPEPQQRWQRGGQRIQGGRDSACRCLRGEEMRQQGDEPVPTSLRIF